jgi:hypothetical protein
VVVVTVVHQPQVEYPLLALLIPVVEAVVALMAQMVMQVAHMVRHRADPEL